MIKGYQRVATIKWIDTFETGFKFIDDDHKHLFGIIQKIQKAQDADDPAACRDAVGEFLDQVKAHFRREEEYLALINFPGRVFHVEEHRQLVAKVEQLLAAMQFDPKTGQHPELDQELVENALYYLLEDIIKADAEFKTLEYESR